MSLVYELRNNGIVTNIDYDNLTNVKKQLKKAEKWGAGLVCFVGEDEIRDAKFKLKDLASGHEEQVAASSLLDYLRYKGF
jgi:histidyl-tRNA synthetase